MGFNSCVGNAQLETVYWLEGLGPPKGTNAQLKSFAQQVLHAQARPGTLCSNAGCQLILQNVPSYFNGKVLGVLVQVNFLACTAPDKQLVLAGCKFVAGASFLRAQRTVVWWGRSNACCVAAQVKSEHKSEHQLFQEALFGRAPPS